MSTQSLTPADYDAWYESERGRWIGDVEFDLLWRMMAPRSGSTILDVGCGTGYFTRRFAGIGLKATGIDVAPPFIEYAKNKDPRSTYHVGSAEALPFPDKSFDYCSAVTSLCFVKHPETAMKEMTRVARKGVAVGLLNRRSLLCLFKRGKGAYSGARWDIASEVSKWTLSLGDQITTEVRYAVFLPSGSGFAKGVEKIMPSRIPIGGFVAFFIKQTPEP